MNFAIFHSKNFYRGIFIPPLAYAVQLIIQVTMQPVSWVSNILSYGTVISAFVAAVILWRRRRDMAIGLLIGAIVSFIIPIVYIFTVFAFDGDLM